MAAQHLHAASNGSPNPPADPTQAPKPPLLNAAYEEQGYTLSSLPKSWRYTSLLPHDTVFPTPADSHRTPRTQIGPRQVRNAAFTWVRPEKQKEPELLAVSPTALKDLRIKPSEVATAGFRDFASGNTILGWDEEKLEGEGYPWAQCYGGFQFGQWAGQLGDGRAISLFETTPSPGGPRYEIQLKGAGMTPYSRFADGKAVLRSSIREFIVSEALNALGIPTTRALALTLLPHSRVRRETMEPGAIVVRFAQSWIRLGNFDILRARGDRVLVRKLATYVAEEVYGGWETLPGRLVENEGPKSESTNINQEKPSETIATTTPTFTPSSIISPPRNIPSSTTEGPSSEAENRFARLYREIVRRNALSVAKWQAYGFTNGVLNTDNTSIFGLSIDFGPFAFLDNFDPAYTPNHDDHALRYSYRNQPTIIWWNLVRLGEALGELLGAGAGVDEDGFVEDGVQEGQEDGLVERAENVITRAGEEYKAVFMAEYRRLMSLRMGLLKFQESDFEELFSEALDIMEVSELDFTHFFRRLSNLRIANLTTEEDRLKSASIFFHHEEKPAKASLQRLATWLETWKQRITQDWTTTTTTVDDHGAADLSPERDEERRKAMRKVNPSFIPRGYILDEIIQRVEKQGERDVLRRVMHMALHPFEDEWDGKLFEGVKYDGDYAEEKRWIGDVPRQERAMQCSCSS